MRQIAALPYTTDADGAMQILLITSRETRRWVIPKGNRIKGMAGHRAAELEAYEEAGIHGIACPAPLDLIALSSVWYILDGWDF